jgi:hypothetical protein
MEGFDFKWVLDSFYLLVFSDEWFIPQRNTQQHNQPTNQQPTTTKTWMGRRKITAHKYTPPPHQLAGWAKRRSTPAL